MASGLVFVIFLLTGSLLDDGEALILSPRGSCLSIRSTATARQHLLRVLSGAMEEMEEVSDDPAVSGTVQPKILVTSVGDSSSSPSTATTSIAAEELTHDFLPSEVTHPWVQQEQQVQQLPYSQYFDRSLSEAYILLQAAVVGVLAGAAVAGFKYSIEETRQIAYGFDFAHQLMPLIPALGGLTVGLLMMPGSFSPGLKGSVREVDNDARRTVSGLVRVIRHPFGFLRKTMASVATLGTGSSLGPEGPSVEVGMSMSRIIMNACPPIEYLFRNQNQRISNVDDAVVIQRNRLLLSCGAAAGVSAGFNAPIAGVFFALEIVEGAFAEVERTSSSADRTDTKRSPLSIAAILVASVLSALVFRTILGNEVVLSVSNYDLKTPLNELPLYLMLGAVCGVVAFSFSQTAKVAKSVFDGEIGPQAFRDAVKSLPYGSKPMIGGLLCGLIAIPYPQILFFGYATLNALLNSVLDDSLPLILSLLVVKTIATALAAGSGLVGGTFAPSLFLGAMSGAAFHQMMGYALALEVPPELVFSNQWEIADGPAYAMVGAASVLAALFRAPLTASLLLFELTRDYDVLLPLMASAGIGSVVSDIIESLVEKEEVEELRRDRDSVSWGDLADKKVKE